MSTAKLLLLSCAVASSLGISQVANAEHCRWRFEHAFSQLANQNLRGFERANNPAEVQTKLEAYVDQLFGPRPAQCEEGAYSLFLQRYESYSVDALRQSGSTRELRLRTAMSLIRKSPKVVDYTTASREITLFRQTAANISAVAQDAGMSPTMQQLVAAIESVGPPKATPRPPAAPTDAHVAMVYVPTVPLPAWAVVSLYEIDDHTRRNEVGAIQGKVEAILTWMKTVTPASPPQP